MAILRTKGIAFPLLLTSGGHTLEEGVDLIQKSIMTILSWTLFTREYEDQFGSRVFELLEEPNDDVLITLLRRFTQDSLESWESRIELVNLDIYRTASDKVTVDIIYKIKELNIQASSQYLFYTNQGI